MFQITHVQSKSDWHPQTKRFFIGDDGLVSLPAQHGRALSFEVRNIASMAEFAEYLRRQTDTESTIFGIPSDASGFIPAKGAEDDTGTRRTDKNFPYPAAPTIMTIDFDNMAEGDTYEVIFDAFPALRDYPHVVASSTSSNLYYKGQPVSEKRGLHVYFLLEDGTKMRSVAKIMEACLILAGHCVVVDVETNGVHNLRAASAIDLQPMMSSGRCDYNGGAALRMIDADGKLRPESVGDLTQERQIDYVAGNGEAEAVPVAIFGELTEEDAAKVSQTKADALEAKRASIRSTDPKAKFAAVEANASGIVKREPLAPSEWLHFSDGTSATVEQVVANPTMFAGRNVACPARAAGGIPNRFGEAKLVTDSAEPFIMTYVGGANWLYPLTQKKTKATTTKNTYADLSKGKPSDRFKTRKAASPDLQEPSLKDWCFLRTDGKFYNTVNGSSCSVQSFNLSMTSVTPSVEIDGKMKRLAASITLLDHLGGMSVDGTMYRPDIDDLFFDHDGQTFVNSYIATPIVGEAAQADIDALADHIFRVFDAGDAEHLIKWMAHNVQFPGRKIRWSPVLVGIEGDGKTTVLEIIGAALGRRHVQPVGPNEVTSQFNPWAEGKCVVGFEEIRVAGQNRSEVMNQLKPLITNAEVRVVGKGQDGRTVVNVTNQMMFTNHADALMITGNDRRYGVLKTKLTSVADLTVHGLTQAHFAQIYDIIKNRPIAARAWLMSVDLTDFDIDRAPMSEAKAKMVEYSESGPLAALKAILAQTAVGVGSDIFSTAHMNIALREQGAAQVQPRQWAMLCDQLGFTKYEGKVKWEGGVVTVYYKPTPQRVKLSDEMLRAAIRRDLTDATKDDDEKAATDRRRALSR